MIRDLSPSSATDCSAVTALLAFFLLAGATYQGVATALERHRFARPGGLVDAGGHQLHIYCTGQGSPVVVLEAAAGSMSAAWGWIQPEVARTTRVCSYDRAGLGWSEAGDGLYMASRVPEELRVLLDRANETGPIVLVGHEAGALFARLYAARFVGSTAALVLIDDPTTGQAPSRHVRLGVAVAGSSRSVRMSRQDYRRSRQDCPEIPVVRCARS